MKKINNLKESCDGCETGKKHIGHYRQMWNWIKGTFTTLAVSIIIAVGLFQATMSLIQIQMMIDERKDNRHLISWLAGVIVHVETRLDYEVPATASLKRSLLWIARDKKNRKLYLKNYKLLKKKYPNLIGHYDKDWTY